MSNTLILRSEDPLKYKLSVNYYRDLSDSFGTNGRLLFGEFETSKSYGGIALGYGQFQSQSSSSIKIEIEEINETIEIPIEEMTIMQEGSFSGIVKPIQREWIEIDILLGLAFAKSKSSVFKSVDYEYSLIENQFTYLIRDYWLVKTRHIGYQVGFNITFLTSKGIGFQLDARLQDLSNGGTFFLVGGGLCIKI